MPALIPFAWNLHSQQVQQLFTDQFTFDTLATLDIDGRS